MDNTIKNILAAALAITIIAPAVAAAVENEGTYVLQPPMMSSTSASNSKDKPRCSLGQVAKLDARTSKWACAPLSMKAKPGTDSSSRAPKPTMPMMPAKVMSSSPSHAKPDLIIKEITKVPGFDNKFQVKVQNIGSIISSPATLSGEDTTGQGGGGTMPIPSLKPSFYSAIVFQVPSAHIDHGDRIKFFADAYKKVNETNENNNIKYYSVP